MNMGWNDIVRKIPQCTIDKSEGDYKKDGIVFCGKCNSPRQVKVLIGDIMLVRNCLCQCRSKQYEEEMERVRAEQERIRLQTRMKIAIRDKTYSNWTFSVDDGDEPKMAKLRKYANEFQEVLKNNLGLLLWGDVGTGKSFGAACVVNELVQKGYSCHMTTFAALSNTLQGLKGDDRNEFIRSLNMFHLLVIDDLGAERQSDFVQELVFQVVDGRYRANKPIIVTTNLTLEQLKTPTDVMQARIYSRLLEWAIPIQFTYKRRERKGKESMQKLIDILRED